MAHDIEIKNNKASFFSVKEKAWHGLGTLVQEAPNSAEAIKLAQLDFKVNKQPLYTHNRFTATIEEAKNSNLIIKSPSGEDVEKSLPTYKQGIIVPDKVCIVREDTGTPFGLVSSSYEIFQNNEAFDFFDSIVGEGAAVFETAGALNKGETIFITAKLPSHFKVGGKDVVDKYLLLTSSHDGNSSITVMFTPIRVVCNNTLTMALQGRDKLRFKHTKNLKTRMKQAEEILGISNTLFDDVQQILDASTKIKVNDEEAMLLLLNSLEIPVQEDGKVSTRSKNILDNAMEYYISGVGQDNDLCRGTLYGVYNGLTGFYQNVKNFDSEEIKMDYITKGTGYSRVQNLFDIIKVSAEKGEYIYR